jgi:hypothetical protein
MHVDPATQVVPHMPQFVSSVFVSTHAPLQLVCPAAHCNAHCPFVHTSLGAQAIPHMPQFMGSLLVVVHAPLQLVSPAAH